MSEKEQHPFMMMFAYIILFVLFVLSLNALGLHSLIMIYFLLKYYDKGLSRFCLSSWLKRLIALGIFFLLWMILNSYSPGISFLIDENEKLRNEQRHNMTWIAYTISLFNPFAYLSFIWQSLLTGFLWYAAFGRRQETPGEIIIEKLLSKQTFFKKRHIRKINSIEANNKRGTTLGIAKTGDVIALSDESANGHTLILGTTGSGKTVSILNIVESAIERGLPVVFVDGKGDEKLGRKIIEFAQANNRPAYLFSKESKNCLYNPLYTGSFTSKKDRIMGLREWTEPYYQRRAEEYIQIIFKILDKCGINPDMAEAIRYLNTTEISKLIRKTELPEEEKSNLATMLVKAKELEKDADGAVAELRLFINSDIGEVFNTKDKPAKDILILENAIEERAVVYFSLPSMEGKESASLLGKLIINDLKAIINLRKNKYGDSRKFYAIFDEFSVFAGEQILNIINMGRSGGVCGVISTQTTADLSGSVEKAGESFISRVISNCNNYIIHRLNDSKVAEEISNIIGTRDTLELTGKIVGDSFGDEGSMKAVKEFKIHPDEIKELERGNAIFLSKSPYTLCEIIVRHSLIDR